MTDTGSAGHDIFNFLDKLSCQELHMYNDKKTGLKAIVAIHNTKLGPTLGGCRCFDYNSTYDASVDVVRLSQGMTYKSAVAGLNLGGGKAVILHDSKKITNREDFFKAFGRFVDSLGGRYITAVDVGTTAEDMGHVRSQTKHVTCHNKVTYSLKDPSPMTSLGVFRAIQASHKKLNGTDSLEGIKVNVQGLGHVGYYLIELLTKHGAKVKGYDIQEECVNRCVKDFGIEVAKGLDDILYSDCDVFSPCAMGAILSEESINKIKAKIIAGGANNQLKYPDDIKHIQEKGIIYAPDFVINAGGIIYVAGEYFGDTEKNTVSKVDAIYDITLNILNQAEQNNIDSFAQAYAIAEARLSEN